MKRTVFTIILGTILGLSCIGQQVSLFDRNGDAVAYVDYGKEATIFLWGGTPVAFLNGLDDGWVGVDQTDSEVIGFDGTWLGWYIDGVMYKVDSGRRKLGKGNGNFMVGFSKGAFQMNTKAEGKKGKQEAIPVKPKFTAGYPDFGTTDEWSDTSLIELLYSGKK